MAGSGGQIEKRKMGHVYQMQKKHYNMQGTMHTKGSIYRIHVTDRMVHRLDACTVNGLSHEYKPHTRSVAQYYACLIYTVHTQTTSIHTALYET